MADGKDTGLHDDPGVSAQVQHKMQQDVLANQASGLRRSWLSVERLDYFPHDKAVILLTPLCILFLQLFSTQIAKADENDWDFVKDVMVSGEKFHADRNYHCQTEIASTTVPGTRIVYTYDTIKKDNDTYIQVTTKSRSQIQFDVCAQNCTFSCDEIHVTLKWKVVKSLDPGGFTVALMPKGHYYLFNFIHAVGPGGALFELEDFGTGRRKPDPGTPWNVPPNSSPSKCAEILADLAKQVGDRVEVRGGAVFIYPSSRENLWYNIQWANGVTPIDDITEGDS